MREFISRYSSLIVLAGAVIMTVIIFRGYFFQHKTLFPSNLLVSSYAPWKYEPYPEYPSGPPNKPMGFDDIRQFFPNRVILKDTLLKGVLPLWNPYIYSGTPFMAAFDTAVWYPLSWGASLFDASDGWSLLVIVQPLLAVLFMYLFLKSLKFSTMIAAYGSFVYAFSGWMVVYWQEILVLEHSFLWLPLALYASNRIWKKADDTPGFVLLIIALVCSVFAGFLQMSIYVWVVAVAWNIYCYFSADHKHRLDSGKRVVMALGFSILIACVQLVPSLEAYRMSPRGDSEGSFIFRDFLLPLQYLVTLVAPDFWGSPATYNYFGGEGFYFEKMIFIGIVPLLFALYGILSSRKKSVLFWSAAAIITFSFGFALPTSWLPNILHIPVLSSSYPTRVFAVSVFALSVLSSYGLSSYFTKPNRKLITFVLVGLTLLLASGWVIAAGSWCVFHNYPRSALWCSERFSFFIDFVRNNSGIMHQLNYYATVSLRNLLLPTLFMIGSGIILLLFRYSRKYTIVLVWLLMLTSAFYFAQKYIYFAERRFTYPELTVTKELSMIAGYDRIWGFGNAFIEKNLPEYFRWFSTDGYGNLSSGRYAELLSTVVHSGRLGSSLRRSDTDLFATSERDAMDSNPYRLRMMSLLGVKYILETKTGDLKDTRSTQERFPSTLFTLMWEDKTWRIWQYNEALPRVMFPTKVIVESDNQKIVNLLYDKNIDLSRTVILDHAPVGMSEYSGAATGSATMNSYSLNTVSIQTQSPSDGFVLLTDTYFMGWTASVDGKPAPVLRADYTLRAVPVSKGSHTVIFTYMPRSFVIGAVLTFIGIAGAVFVAIKRRHSTRQH